jgi:ATP-dependent Lon protease
MDLFDNNALNMPMVALRGLVVFPNITLHFDVGRKKSISAVKTAMITKQDIFLSTQKDMSDEAENIDAVYDIGVVCEIKQIVRIPSSDCLRVIVEGKYRAELLAFSDVNPYFTAVVKRIDSIPYSEKYNLRAEALVRYAKGLFNEYSVIAQKLPNDINMGVAKLSEPGALADYIAGNIPLDYPQKQEVLSEIDSLKRIQKLVDVLGKEVKLLQLEEDINDRVQSQIDENQKEYYLHEQLKAINAELGEGDNPASEADGYREKILKLHLDADSEKKLLNECDRLKYVQPSSPESAVSRNYLDKILELPWHIYSKENLNIDNARRILDRDHYGLKDVKERILEFIAVRKLSPNIKGQIICLVGPPGVGKTSVAKSLAKALNRKYERISLGGVHDEAEIRGHRKTYIGAMPGSIIEAVIRTKTSNPLILLDEIDKLASDYKGDPSSALLEALDPEQNNTFRDHYIEIPFDLSKVLFVTTANDKNEIPAPLLDRMEVIELFSYTHEEKFNIAKKHLIPKQLKENGIKASQLHFTDNAIHSIIDGYTREAGVRTLERTFAKVMRKAAVKITEGYTGKISVKPTGLEAYLGPKKYKPESQGHKDEVGVVNGLAWTSVGGEMLKVEAVKMPGTGKLELTGSLGDVMKESARTAYSYIRSISETLPLDMDFYKNTDIHIHFPEGAVPKDGPSAGIAITTAVVSALTGIPVRADIAMTGEVTLTGNVLPIGGLKEKTMAAYRNGIKTVLIPEENVSDLKEIDDAVKENVDFISVSKADEVLSLALSKNVVAKDNKQRSIKLKQDRSQTASVCQQN